MASSEPAAAAATDAPAPAKAYSTDPALYIYTSLTAGSSHIVTATSRLETILRANKVPFKAIDIATDDKARMLWGRRAGKDESGRMRKLPGLVQMGLVLGDLVEIEEWNEYGELKQHVTIYYDEFTQPSIHQAPKIAPKPAKPALPAGAVATAAATAAAAAAAPHPPPPPELPSKAGDTTAKVTLPIRSIAEEAAQKAKQVKLQSLRDKVHGKGGSKEGGKEAEQVSLPTVDTSAKTQTAAGLQSPTTGAWKDGVDQLSLEGAALRTVQSPTSTSWKPTDVDAPITSWAGSVVASASEEEIRAVERSETIEEKPEEEEEAEEEDNEEEDGGDDDEEEEKKPKEA